MTSIPKGDRVFTKKPKPEKTELDKAIDELFLEMRGFTAETEEYAAMVDQLLKLYALKSKDEKSRLSPDTMLIVAGNLVGIVMIVAYEQKNVATSKALNFITKLR
jgi:hypothetical protein